MLGNETLWDAARECHATLAAAEIPHLVVGGVAVCLHGYRRNTVDVDLLVRREDADRIRQVLDDAGFAWSAAQHEFRSPSGVPIQVLLAGDRAGSDSDVRLPDPAAAEAGVEREGLPVLALPRLIESKVACGQGNLRRTHKDFADVVELIAVHRLDRGYARFLHKSVRATYRRLVEHGRSSP